MIRKTEQQAVKDKEDEADRLIKANSIAEVEEKLSMKQIELQKMIVLRKNVIGKLDQMILIHIMSLFNYKPCNAEYIYRRFPEDRKASIDL